MQNTSVVGTVGEGYAITKFTPLRVQLMVLDNQTDSWKRSTTWQRYCGFLDLSLNEFSEIQRELLMEELALVKDSPLGRRLLRGSSPKSVEEFRRTARLSKYGDYLPDLAQNNGSGFLAPVQHWVQTTGARAEYKHIPYTSRAYDVVLDNLMAAFILGCANRKGEVNLDPQDRILYNTPPRPFLSGHLTFDIADRFGFKGVLDPWQAEDMEFRERIEKGFRRALDQGVDILISMSSILVKIGQEFVDQHKKAAFSPSMVRPGAVARLGRAFLSSKVNRRPTLPKDLWSPKAILAWGIDAAYFKSSVEYFWGSTPYEFYACTEGGVMALQGWNKLGMTLVPYSNFYEFIPEQESIKSWEDNEYRPETLLIDELEEGKQYELVITNFYGMPLLRYRVGHLVRVLSLEDTATGVRLPQIEFSTRCDDRIDLAGFTRMDEKTFWEALRAEQLSCRDWIVRKEYRGSKMLLHLYGEFSSKLDEEEISETIDERLKANDPFYQDLQQMLDIHPLRVTRLPSGAFDSYYDRQLDRGLPLPMRRPLRMKASDSDIQELTAGCELKTA